jgi:hypothetical protein
LIHQEKHQESKKEIWHGRIFQRFGKGRKKRDKKKRLTRAMPLQCCGTKARKKGAHLLQGLDAARAAGVGGVAAALLQVLDRNRGRGVLGRRTAPADGERGGAAERADLVEPDPAEAEHGVARRVGPRQRHPAPLQRVAQRVHALLVVVRHHVSVFFLGASLRRV